MFVHGKSELPTTSGCNFKLNARKAHFHWLTRAHHLVIKQLSTRHRKRICFCTLWVNSYAQNSYLWYEGADIMYLQESHILISWIMHDVSLFQETLCGKKFVSLVRMHVLILKWFNVGVEFVHTHWTILQRHWGFSYMDQNFHWI